MGLSGSGQLRFALNKCRGPRCSTLARPKPGRREGEPPPRAGWLVGGELAGSSFPWFHLSSILSRAELRFLRPGDFPAQACFSHCPT